MQCSVSLSTHVTELFSYHHLLGEKRSVYLLQIPFLQGIVATVKDFPQCGSKAPFITLQSQVVWGVKQFWGHPGDPVQDHCTKKTPNMSSLQTAVECRNDYLLVLTQVQISFGFDSVFSL